MGDLSPQAVLGGVPLALYSRSLPKRENVATISAPPHATNLKDAPRMAYSKRPSHPCVNLLIKTTLLSTCHFSSHLQDRGSYITRHTEQCVRQLTSAILRIFLSSAFADNVFLAG